MTPTSTINKREESALITTTITGKELLLHYDRRTEKTSYSIFDLSGNELISGALTASSPYALKLPSLAAGIYCLCVIDGDQLHQVRFNYP